MTKETKFYAVKAGRETGIFKSWPECWDSVRGYSGAKFKSFRTREEAEAFLENAESKPSTVSAEDTAIAYVDGSFNNDSYEYGSGVVLFYRDNITEISKKGSDPDLVGMRNVAGEVLGSVLAINLAIKLGAKHIQICHDYTGISEWALGNWKTNKAGTQRYKQFIDSAKPKIEISFKKIAAHAGNTYNERADVLAKNAVGLATTTLVQDVPSDIEYTAETKAFTEEHPELCKEIDTYIKHNSAYEEFDILDMFLDDRTEAYIQNHQNEVAEIIGKLYKFNLTQGNIKIF